MTASIFVNSTQPRAGERLQVAKDNINATQIR